MRTRSPGSARAGVLVVGIAVAFVTTLAGCGRSLGFVPGDDLALPPADLAAPLPVLGFAAPLAQNVGPLSITWLADFNGDGKMDIGLSGANPQAHLDIVYGKGDGTFGGRLPTAIPNPYSVIDIDGDGFADVVYPNQNYAATPMMSSLAVGYGAGDGTFARAVTIVACQGSVGPPAAWSCTQGDRPPESAISADFDGDGLLDEALVSKGAGVLVALNRRTTYAFSGPFAPTVTASCETTDVNGDGKIDLLTLDGSMLGIQLGYGAGALQRVSPVRLGSGTGQITGYTPGDMNGDGHVDLLSVDALLNVQLGRGDGSFADPLSHALAMPSAILHTADFDGDGRLDVVLAWRTSSTVKVLLGAGDGTFRAEQDFDAGILVHAIQIADYNGDRRLDLAVNDGQSLVVLLNTSR